MSGWITMHRGWRDCAAFEPAADPMSDADAWFWLVENAAWKNMTRRGGQGQAVAVLRGQIHVSDRSLAAAFRWDKKRVRRYLDRLQANQMVDQSKDQSGTILTICNYDKYQSRDNTKGPVNGTAAGPVEDQLGTSLSDGKEKEKSGQLALVGTTHITNNSLSKDKGVPPTDMVTMIWNIGVSLLVASGQDERASRSIVGRWRKGFKDGPVLEALLDCQAKRISNPVEWMPRRLAAAAANSNTAKPKFGGHLAQKYAGGNA